MFASTDLQRIMTLLLSRQELALSFRENLSNYQRMHGILAGICPSYSLPKVGLMKI